MFDFILWGICAGWDFALVLNAGLLVWLGLFVLIGIIVIALGVVLMMLVRVL